MSEYKFWSRAQVKEIRNNYIPVTYQGQRNLLSHRILAQQYNVSKSTIQFILNGRNWKRVLI